MNVVDKSQRVTRSVLPAYIAPDFEVVQLVDVVQASGKSGVQLDVPSLDGKP